MSAKKVDENGEVDLTGTNKSMIYLVFPSNINKFILNL